MLLALRHEHGKQVVVDQDGALMAFSLGAFDAAFIVVIKRPLDVAARLGRVA